MNNDNEIQLRVAIYLRVSTDEQIEKYGLAAQRAAIEGIIKSRGVLKDNRPAMVAAGKEYEYIDEGESGTKNISERPAFARLMEDVLLSPQGQRPFDVVAVYKIDRFARKLTILLDVFKFFKDYGIEFVSATESIDTSTPFGRAMLGIMGVIAELELETIKERTQRGKEQASLQGKIMGPHTPYGYKKDKEGRLEILEEEAEVVKRIYSLFLINKYTPQKIADTLTNENILTPDASSVRNKKHKGISRKITTPFFWRAERVREILKNDVYIGKSYFNKTHKGKRVDKKDWRIAEFTHPSVVTPQFFELATTRLLEYSDKRNLTTKKEREHIYLLSGLLKCEHCKEIGGLSKDKMGWTGGKKLVDKKTNQYSYYYYCNRKNKKKFSTVCTVLPIPAEELEKYIVNFIKKLLDNPKAVFEYQKNLNSRKLEIKKLEISKTNLERILSEIPNRRQNLLVQHELGMIDKTHLEEKISSMKAEEKKNKDALTKLNFKLSQETLSKGYVESLSLFASKYGNVIDEILEDRKQLYEIIHMLINQINVYSRARNEKDVIAGRRKEEQFIPEKIDIYLQLPQDLLRELYAQRFLVKSAIL